MKRTRKATRLLVSALLVLGILLAAVPQPARAATTCVRYHIVRSGDTTAKIAHTYGLKWKEIAIANDMEQPYKLKVGDSLCIPGAGTVKVNETEETLANPKARLTVTVTGKRISITTSKFSTDTVSFVKVRDATVSVRGWYKVGVLKSPKNKVASGTYQLPKELAGTLYLQVCLKDLTANDLICRTVLHYY